MNEVRDQVGVLWRLISGVDKKHLTFGVKLGLAND